MSHDGMRRSGWRLGALGAALLCLCAAQLDAAARKPGTLRGKRPRRPGIHVASVSPFVQETGRISLSMDATGTNQPAGTVQVEKPAGATVRAAYLLAASTGQSGRVIANGEVSLDGTPITWDAATSSAIGSNNYLANVTSLVKPKIDAAAAGTIDFTVTEVGTGGIEGEILAVIFNDPNQTTDNTVAFLFGAQNTSGDRFAVALAEPINKNNPNLRVEMSLGISYGFQPGGQFSTVDVNGQRLTSSAGGQDDGEPANGALITVGGIGDSTANPADPNAGPSNERTDDELYDLLPFVQNGDTSITVDTRNPSNDDNIFFSAFFFRSATALIGEGVVLSPLAATNPVNTPHTVTATVQDDEGDPVTGREVTFTVTQGPHQGVTGTDVTDAQGQATFTYTGTQEGTDTIEASFVSQRGETIRSNAVTKTWNRDGTGDPEAPVCRLTGTNPTAIGTIQFTARDTTSGLAAIEVVEQNNVVVTLPEFSPGSTDAQVVSVRRQRFTFPGSVTLLLRDVDGNETRCQGIFTVVETDRCEVLDQFRSVPGDLSFATIHSSRSGTTFRIRANRGTTRVTTVNNQVKTLNLEDDFRSQNNAIVFAALNHGQARVLVVLSDRRPE